MVEEFCKDKLAPLALRLALGASGLYHGYLKIMASGGMSWSPGLPIGWQLGIAWTEFAAGLAMLLGFYCRVAASGFLAATTASVAIWYGWRLFTLPVSSLEALTLTLLAGLALLFLGAGEWSLDARSGSPVGTSTSRASRRSKLAA